MIKPIYASCVAIALSYSSPAYAGLMGKAVDLNFHFPLPNLLFCSSGSAVVSAAVEFPEGCADYAPVSVDIFDDGLSVSLSEQFWTYTIFNGLKLSTVAGSFSDVFYTGGTMGVTSARVTDGEIWLDFSGNNSGIAHFRFTLKNDATEVAESSALALFGLGAVSVILARRRKLSTNR